MYFYPFRYVAGSIDSKARLHAKDSMRWPFFDILKDVRDKATSTCLLYEINGDMALNNQKLGLDARNAHKGFSHD